MANYDPKRSRPTTDVDDVPSQIDALLDGADRASTPEVTADHGVVDLRGEAEATAAVTTAPANTAPANTAPANTAPANTAPASEHSDVRRSPIVPVPGPDHRSRRLVNALIATASGVAILAVVRAIQRSRRS